MATQGRAYEQRCFKTCQGGTDAPTAGTPAATALANETMSSIPDPVHCVSNLCKGTGSSTGLEPGDTVIFGSSKANSRVFDETKPHTTAENLGKAGVDFKCQRSNFPNALADGNGMDTCWFEKGPRAPIDESKKLCGGASNDSVKVASVY